MEDKQKISVGFGVEITPTEDKTTGIKDYKILNRLCPHFEKDRHPNDCPLCRTIGNSDGGDE